MRPAYPADDNFPLVATDLTLAKLVRKSVAAVARFDGETDFVGRR